MQAHSRYGNELGVADAASVTHACSKQFLLSTFIDDGSMFPASSFGKDMSLSNTYLPPLLRACQFGALDFTSFNGTIDILWLLICTRGASFESTARSFTSNHYIMQLHPTLHIPHPKPRLKLVATGILACRMSEFRI